MKTDTDIICGLDEAGRGALAGPIVAAAVILHHPAVSIAKQAGVPLRDGKLLSPLQRERMYAALRDAGTQIGVESISARCINSHGVGWANREIFRRLIKRFEADSFIVDGKLRIGKIAGKTERIQSIVDADASIHEVICAGIVAKVTRDAMMKRLHEKYPHFRWDTNAGYGTQFHIGILAKCGATPVHRTLFIRTALANFP